jgi:hypothetical protein
MSLIFKNDARSLPRLVTLWQKFVDTPVNGRPSLFHIDSVQWRHLFLTLCWSINTKSMYKTIEIKIKFGIK